MLPGKSTTSTSQPKENSLAGTFLAIRSLPEVMKRHVTREGNPKQEHSLIE